MPKTAKTANTEAKVEKTMDTLAELKTKLVEIKLSIKAGQEKNTNAHKKMKKEIAQLLTKSNKK
ncbi:MAG TPA: 50S ribosomal protein L29 [Patescibacteria group bacterium]